LEDVPKTDYEFYVIHQEDSREFNRGAMKNIGFLYIKEKYPKDYSHITLVFNDVDTMPQDKHYINYYTTPGVIKHFCGFVYTLGGIVSITGQDFEKLTGYPNFWAWGYEDNTLYQRAKKRGMIVDRSVFCDFHSDKKFTNFISLSSGSTRTINKTEYNRYMKYTTEGAHSIRNLRFDLDNTRVIPETTPEFPAFTFSSNTQVINIQHFDTGIPPPEDGNVEYDLRNGITPFGKVLYRRNGRFPMINMNM
jgi:hypothetical protein